MVKKECATSVYAKEHNIANGISETKFGTGNMNLAQYTTLVLRALGYDDSKGDFKWNTSVDKALEIGLLTEGEAKALIRKDFLRGDLALISYNGLKAKTKDKGITLLQALIDNRSIKISEVYDAKDNDLSVIVNKFSNEYDTDGDGLSDFQEIFKYFTDPNNPDSDGDGILDGD